jgi:ABC-type glycerol-3-phosphate transport system permease component
MSAHHRNGATLAVHAVLLVAAAITLTPFVWLACASLKRNEDFFSSAFLPVDAAGAVDLSRFTGEHFTRLLTGLGMGRALVNSFYLSSVTAILAALFAAMGGFALALHRFRGRSLVTALVLGAVIIPAPLLLAPGYQLLFRLGLLDTFAGLILPALAPAFGVFLFRQATLSSVPATLLEAARIDGCSEVRTFFSIGLPLLRPMFGAFVLIVFLGTWNNYISPQVVLQSPGKFPLAVAVANLKNTYYQDYGLLMAGAVVSIVPVLFLFLLLQRDFIAGLTSGAVKG